ncbi:undecaprenyl-diphosphate phosphatase [Patescibacteria group bacterium]
MGEYILLGILQGIFEWIPISSEGVVALASQVMKKDLNPVDIALFLHLGTLLAVLFYFKKDWIHVLTLKDLPLIRFLVIATIVSLTVGYPLYNGIRDAAVGNGLLVIMGFGLLFTAYVQKKEKKTKLSFDQLAVVSGFLQGLAVIPGLSRSGSTIFGLSLAKIPTFEVLKLSFMMSVPVVIVSSTYLFLKNPSLISEAWLSLVSSFMFGLLSLHVLISLVKKINFFTFALGFSILCFLGAAVGFLS